MFDIIIYMIIYVYINYSTSKYNINIYIYDTLSCIVSLACVSMVVCQFPIWLDWYWKPEEKAYRYRVLFIHARS